MQDTAPEDINPTSPKDTSMQDTPNPPPKASAPTPSTPQPGDFYTYATHHGEIFRVKYAPSTQRLLFTDEASETQYWYETQER